MAVEPEAENFHVLFKNRDGEDCKHLMFECDVKFEVADEDETTTGQYELEAVNIKEELEEEDPEMALEELPRLRKRKVKVVDDEYLPPSLLKKNKREYSTRKRLKEKLYPCETCGRTFFHPANRDVHSKVHEAPTENHRCDMCGRNLGSAQSLKDHKRNHTVPRTKCNYCKVHFDSREELSKHQALNECARHHSCDGCGQLFIREYSLHQHQRACPEKVRLSTSSCTAYRRDGSEKPVVDDCVRRKSVCRTYSRKKNVSVQPSVKIEQTACKSNDLYILST